MNASTRVLAPGGSPQPPGVQSAETLLATAVWGAGIGLWELDLPTGAIRWHGDFTARLNLDHRCEGHGQSLPWSSYVHPEDAAEASRRFSDHLCGKAGHYEAEYRLRDREGRWRWLFERGRVVERASDGSALRVVGVCLDIDPRKQAELEYLNSQKRLEEALESARGGMWETQQALRKSEFRYRTVASLAPGFVFEHRVSSEGKPLPDWASEGIESIFGCRYDQIDDYGGWFALIDEEWRAIAAERQARLAKGEPQSGETRVHTIYGEKKWLYVSMLPVRDPHTGAVTSVLGAAYDITTRKLAEQALRESEAILRAVTENTPDWLFLVDETLRVRFVNRPFGPFTVDQMLGRRLLQLTADAHRESLETLYREVQTSGRPGRIELRHVAADGIASHFEHRVVPVIEAGEVRSLTVAVTDVTERHAQQDAMRTQARILETMREGVVLIDAATHVVKLTNPMFVRMFGYESREELLGRSVAPLFSTKALQRKRGARSARDGTALAEVMPVELECARKDGSRFVAACVLTPLKMGGSEHWLAVFNDVTERKRLEREIIEISNREQQRIGNDLHDGLGQDLTGIALLLKGVVAQLRREDSAASVDVEDVVTLVNNAIESTRSLARGLSPVSGERGGLTAALQALAARASERYGVRVDFDTSLDEPLRLNETAATHVYRIVQEALTNVVRHSRASEVAIRLETRGGELHLRVDDNGLGFPQPVPDAAGGLGLKIMRYRAQMLGGDLVIESAQGGGASIRCSFPMEPAVSAERP
jgi:PAS domain S-box-containing protein